MEERKKNNEGLRSLAGPGQNEQESKMSEALENVAKEHGIESVTAVALAYVMAKAPYVFPIVGGRKVEHCKWTNQKRFPDSNKLINHSARQHPGVEDQTHYETDRVLGEYHSVPTWLP